MKNPLSHLVIVFIGVYQRHLSHRKGYCCAHHRIRNEGTCSHYGRKVFIEHDFLTAFQLLRQRLKECSAVYDMHVTNMSKAQFEAHWQTRGFMLSPHRVWLEKWRRRRAV